MTFEQALKDLKTNAKVAYRTGWNGKDQFVALFSQDLPPELEPFFAFFTNRGTIQFGWLASQADLLASDWETKFMGSEGAALLVEAGAHIIDVAHEL